MSFRKSFWGNLEVQQTILNFNTIIYNLLSTEIYHTKVKDFFKIRVDNVNDLFEQRPWAEREKVYKSYSLKQL